MKIPAFSNVPHLHSTLNDMMRIIEDNQGRAVSKETANDSVLLQSLDKSVWKITISDSGALGAVKVG